MSATHIPDLDTHLVKGYSIENKTISTDTTTAGAAVDMLAADGPCYGYYTTGNCGDASTIIQIKLTECDTSGGTYTDMSGATVTKSASATTNDNLVGIIKGTRTKRYVKAAVVTSGGGTPSVLIAVSVLSQKKIVGGNGGYQS